MGVLCNHYMNTMKNISNPIVFFIFPLLLAACNCEEAVIITGGTGLGGSRLSSTEIIGWSRPCPVPALPTQLDDHVTALTSDGELLTCGGFGNLQCLAFDMDTNSWQLHSSLDKERGNAAVATLESGLLLIGGYGEGASEASSFLPAGSTTWEAGPTIPSPGVADSCAVSLSSDSFLIIGGAFEPKKVMEYSFPLDRWEDWSLLEEGRRAHACTRFGDKVLVVGGVNQEAGSFLSSAIIIDIVSKEVVETGALTVPRAFLGLALLDGTIWAFGGADSIDSSSSIFHTLDSVEEWNEETGVWVTRDDRLQERKMQFGFARVPTSLLLCAGAPAAAINVKLLLLLILVSSMSTYFT